MEKNFVGALVAQDATSTNPTLILTYTVPQQVSKLVEVGAQLQMAGLTTLEGVSFMLEIECDDATLAGGTQQFVSDTVLPLTQGGYHMASKVHDCNIPVTPGSHLLFTTTFNMALAINPSLRAFGKFT